MAWKSEKRYTTIRKTKQGLYPRTGTHPLDCHLRKETRQHHGMKPRRGRVGSTISATKAAPVMVSMVAVKGRARKGARKRPKKTFGRSLFDGKRRSKQRECSGLADRAHTANGTVKKKDQLMGRRCALWTGRIEGTHSSCQRQWGRGGALSYQAVVRKSEKGSGND